MDLVEDPSPNIHFHMSRLAYLHVSIEVLMFSVRTTNITGADFASYCARSELGLSSASKWICTKCWNGLLCWTRVFYARAAASNAQEDDDPQNIAAFAGKAPPADGKFVADALIYLKIRF
jgi:hypothetical protein